MLGDFTGKQTKQNIKQTKTNIKKQKKKQKQKQNWEGKSAFKGRVPFR